MKKWWILIGVVVVFVIVLAFILIGSDDGDCSNRRYVSNSTELCAVIKYACGEDEEAFNDEFGCGCEVESDCYEGTDRTYCEADSDCVIVEGRDEGSCCWNCGYDAVNVEYSINMRIADCDCDPMIMCKTAPMNYYQAVCNNNVCESVYVGKMGVGIRTDKLKYFVDEKINLTIVNSGDSPVWHKNVCSIGVCADIGGESDCTPIVEESCPLSKLDVGAQIDLQYDRAINKGETQLAFFYTKDIDSPSFEYEKALSNVIEIVDDSQGECLINDTSGCDRSCEVDSDCVKENCQCINSDEIMYPLGLDVDCLRAYPGGCVCTDNVCESVE